jgi:hypothetical protein
MELDAYIMSRIEKFCIETTKREAALHATHLPQVLVNIGAPLAVRGVGSRTLASNTTLNYIMSGFDVLGGVFTFPLVLADLAHDTLVFQVESDTRNAFQLLQIGSNPVSAQLTFGICQTRPLLFSTSSALVNMSMNDFATNLRVNVTFLNPVIKATSNNQTGMGSTSQLRPTPAWQVTSVSLDSKCIRTTATASIPAFSSFAFDSVFISMSTNLCTGNTSGASGTVPHPQTNMSLSCAPRTSSLISLSSPRSASSIVFSHPRTRAGEPAPAVFVSLQDTTPPLIQGCSGDIRLSLAEYPLATVGSNTSSPGPGPAARGHVGSDQLLFQWNEPTFVDNVGVTQITGPFPTAQVTAGAPVSLLLAAKNSPYRITYRAFDAADNTAECSFDLIIQYERRVREANATLSRVSVLEPRILARRSAAENSSLIVISNDLVLPMTSITLSSAVEEINVLRFAFGAPEGLRFVQPSQEQYPGLIASDVEIQLHLRVPDCPMLNARLYVPLGDEYTTADWTDLRTLDGLPIWDQSSLPFVGSSSSMVALQLDAALAAGTVSSVTLLNGLSLEGFRVSLDFPRMRNMSDLQSLLASLDNSTGMCSTRALAIDSTQSFVRFSYYFTPAGFSRLSSHQLLSIRDFTPPVWLNRPSNMTVPANSNLVGTPNSLGAFVTWVEPRATDNIGVVLTNRTHLPGAWFPLNSDLVETSSLVLYRAFDAAGNTASSSFFVTIVDRTPPSLTCPPTVRLAYNMSSGHILGRLEAQLWPAIRVADNSARLSLRASVADAMGTNISVLLTATSFNGATGAWLVPRSSSASSLLTQETNELYVPGNYTVTLIATDTAGNAAPPCITRFEVFDDVIPVFTACLPRIDLFFPDAESLLIANATETELASSDAPLLMNLNWTVPVATDNYLLKSVISLNVNGTVLTPGHQPIVLSRALRQTSLPVFFLATDESQNVAWCNATIVVTNLLVSASGSATDKGGLDSNLPIIIGASAGGAVLLVIVVAAYLHRRSRRQKPADFSLFLDRIATMIAGSKKAAEGGDTGPRRPREIKREHVKIIEQIGMGQFGTVDKALLSENRAIPAYLCAVKQLKSLEAHDISALMEESAVMAQIDSDFCISLIGVVTIGRPMMMVLEYCEHGSLLSYLRKNGSQLSELVRATLGGDCAEGLGYLHHIGLLHRDVSARNVLVSSERRAKISDFGMSREVEEGEYYHSRGGALPVRWSSPEVLENRKFSFKSDIWAAGILLYEIWTDGEVPYGEWSNQRVWVEVTGGKRLPPPAKCCDELYDIMYDCWREDCDERPDTTELTTRLRAYQARVQAQSGAGSSSAHLEEDGAAPGMYDNSTTIEESAEMGHTALPAHAVVVETSFASVGQAQIARAMVSPGQAAVTRTLPGGKRAGPAIYVLGSGHGEASNSDEVNKLSTNPFFTGSAQNTYDFASQQPAGGAAGGQSMYDFASEQPLTGASTAAGARDPHAYDIALLPLSSATVAAQGGSLQAKLADQKSSAARVQSAYDFATPSPSSATDSPNAGTFSANPRLARATLATAASGAMARFAGHNTYDFASEQPAGTASLQERTADPRKAKLIEPQHSAPTYDFATFASETGPGLVLGTVKSALSSIDAEDDGAGMALYDFGSEARSPNETGAPFYDTASQMAAREIVFLGNLPHTLSDHDEEA